MKAQLSSGDYVVITFDDRGCLRGIRVRVRFGRARVIRHATSPMVGEGAEPPALHQRLAALGRDLGVARQTILLVAGIPDGAVYFSCRSVKLPRRDLADSLRFRLPEHFLQMPDDCRLEFYAVSDENGIGNSEPETDGGDEEGELSVGVAAFDGVGLEEWETAFTMLKWRVDAFLHPLLALGVFPSAATVAAPELGRDCCRVDGQWRMRREDVDYNKALAKELRGELGSELTESELIAGAVALFAARRRPRGKVLADFDVLAPGLRPRRFRNQIRIAVALVLIWLGLGVWVGVGAMNEYWESTSRLEDDIAACERDSETLKKKLKADEKQYKEQLRVLETKHGFRNFLPELAQVSELLPNDVCLTNLRAGEDAWDLTLFSDSDEPDVSSLRRLKDLKLTGLQVRTMGDTLKNISVKLTVTEGGSN